MTQNWWRDASGPTHASNPGGLGDRIDSNMIDFQPVDASAATCRLSPPPLQPDLRFRGSEAVQVVQTMDNGILGDFNCREGMFQRFFSIGAEIAMNLPVLLSISPRTFL
jgi:hypothetical protein